jgi:hypothetical protein
LWVFVLSDRGLCDGPIPPPGESYRPWCVSECDELKDKNPDTCCERVEEGRTAIRYVFRDVTKLQKIVDRTLYRNVGKYVPNYRTRIQSNTGCLECGFSRSFPHSLVLCCRIMCFSTHFGIYGLWRNKLFEFQTFLSPEAGHIL